MAARMNANAIKLMTAAVIPILVGVDRPPVDDDDDEKEGGGVDLDGDGVDVDGDGVFVE